MRPTALLERSISLGAARAQNVRVATCGKHVEGVLEDEVGGETSAVCEEGGSLVEEEEGGARCIECGDHNCLARPGRVLRDAVDGARRVKRTDNLHASRCRGIVVVL